MESAFETLSGHYEHFQALVNDVPRDMFNGFVFVYMDDILIFSPDPETHVHLVHLV